MNDKSQNGACKATWVKKKINPKEWESYYSKNDSYCYLRKDGRQIQMAYLITGFIADDEEFLTDEDLRIVDNYRSTKKIFPVPFKIFQDIEKPKK